MSMLHKIADWIGLSRTQRNRVMAQWRRLTRWTPDWYREPKEWGLNREQRETPITVSITSYPGRISSVHHTIATMLCQTVKPDRVVLWLGEDKFPNKEHDLPKNLLKLCEFGLTIGWTRDIRSYTKLLPAMKEYPDDIIITVDDDNYYKLDLVERLYKAHLDDPECVCSQVAMRMEYDASGQLVSYGDWDVVYDKVSKSFANHLMGFGGVLYPPHVMPDETFNESAFKKLAPTTDDLWFWAMVVMNGRLIKTLNINTIDIIMDPMAGGDPLTPINKDPITGQDAQLRNILNAYPVVEQRLKQACKECP